MLWVMMSSPFFSIITVTRNNIKGLKKTAESLTNQTFHDYQWIIIDGASSDSTFAYLKDLTALTISEPDSGIYDAMNKGMRYASGHYVIFMNAGDCFAYTTTLEHIYSSLGNPYPDFVYGDSIESSSSHNFYKPARHYKTIDYGMITHHQAMLYKRNKISDLSYNLNYQISADYAFTRTFIQKSSSIQYLPFAFCFFELGGISQRKAWQGRLEQCSIRKIGGVPILKNTMIFILQAISWQIRHYFPNFYASMRESLLRGNNSHTEI